TRMRRRRTAAMALLLAMLVGCRVGPDYRRPQVELPAKFRGNSPATAQSFADLPWWNVFRDRVLQSLIREALEKNYDIRQAIARVEESRARAGIASAQLWPALGVQAETIYQRGQVPTLGPAAYPQLQVQATFTWELDLWGRLRRLRESAAADYLA